jgi:glycosyltransferase involved in cell wall biosynthesis
MAQHSKNPIQFMGQYINKNLADEVFSKVDCIVVPSIWAENSPLVIHEAQACHIPVITADFGGMKEYVQHQVNGLLFEHRNVKSLQEQMEFAIANPDLMKKLGKRGYLYSKDGKVPDIQSHCEALERFYLQIIKKHKKLSIYE